MQNKEAHGGDESGMSVSLSSDGMILAVGLPLNDQNGPDSGKAQVYNYDYCASEDDGEDKDVVGAVESTVPSFSPSYDPSSKPSHSPAPSVESSLCPPDPNKKAKFWTGELKEKKNGGLKPKTKTCIWLSNAGVWKINKYCNMTEGYWSKEPARDVCTGTCNSC